MSLLLLILGAFIFYAVWHYRKPLPSGLNFRGVTHRIPTDRVRFLTDVSSMDAAGNPVREQQIFATLFELIDQTEKQIQLDFFLFNDHQSYRSAAATTTIPLAEQLTERLLARKQQCPQLQIDIISDPINLAYQGGHSPQLHALQQAGANIILTGLHALRDSNPLYSAWWRLLLRYLPGRGRYLPHPFDRQGEKVSIASWLELLNFKANHRKIAILDHNGETISMITSANPHAASSSHSNVALLVEDSSLAAEIFRSEQAIANFSSAMLRPLPGTTRKVQTSQGAEMLEVQLLTEAAIKRATIEEIRETGTGDRVRLAMFYLADRDVIKALLSAAQRGASVELLLDPNRDAFGYRKNGVPNRPVAAELHRRSGGRIAIRWYRTNGEQFHAKLLLIEKTGGTATLLLGSANFTRRNLGNFNLETDLLVKGQSHATPLADASAWFDKLWQNRHHHYSLPYSACADDSRCKYLQYRIQEGLGLGTF